MEIFFSIVAVLSLIFCSVIIIDKTIFDKRIRDIENGMTGKEVEKVTGRKFITVKGVDGDKIKTQLQKAYNSNTYTSITDKKREIKNEMAIEKSILGILTTVG